MNQYHFLYLHQKKARETLNQNFAMWNTILQQVTAPTTVMIMHLVGWDTQLVSPPSCDDATAPLGCEL